MSPVKNPEFPQSRIMMGGLDTLLIMLEIQNFAQMFGGTYDHKLFCQWEEGPDILVYLNVHKSGNHKI